MAATTFTVFPDLPQDLQIQIWETAAMNHTSRAFIVRRLDLEESDWSVLNTPPGLRARETWTTRQNPGPQAPAILSTTYLSREIGLRHFKLSFGGIDNAPIWFNFQRDTIAVQRELLTEMALAAAQNTAVKPHHLANETSLRADFAQVENLMEIAISYKFARDRPEVRCARRFEPFQNLKSLDVFLQEYSWWWDDEYHMRDYIPEVQEDLIDDVREEWMISGKPFPRIGFMCVVDQNYMFDRC